MDEKSSDTKSANEKSVNEEVVRKLSEILELLKKRIPPTDWPDDAVKNFSEAMRGEPGTGDRWREQVQAIRDEVGRIANPELLKAMAHMLSAFTTTAFNTGVRVVNKYTDRQKARRSEPAERDRDRDRGDDTRQDDVPPDQREKICPDCMSRIPSMAKVCRYCRYRF